MTWPSDGVPGAICPAACESPLSRLGHYPGVGAHFVNTRVQANTMAQTLIDQDFLGCIYTSLSPCPDIISPDLI